MRYTMTRRITCYVVFVTLIWGAHTEKEERRQDMFKSNMTRNDFSKLLSSLIKLNEQRVNVLQRLYRLEDYGVLSEVLRSGNEKTGNGNPSNLFLIVMSKNPTDSSQRKAGFQVVDSVTSLEVAGRINIPKLDYVLDPASFITQNNRKENTLTKSIFANKPRVHKQKKTNLIEDRIVKITTTKKPLQYRIAKKRKKIIGLLMPPKDTFQAKENRRIKIVRQNKNRKASQRLLYTSTVAYNYQSSKSNEIELTIKKYKLTTKPITLKEILASKRKNPKYHLKDKVEQNDDYNGCQFSNISYSYNGCIRNITQINGDMFTKMFVESNNLKPETDKNISKVTVSSIKKIDANNHPKLGTDKIVSKVNDIDVKKIDANNLRKPGTYKIVSMVNDSAVKKIDDNNHPMPGTDKVTSKVTDISVKKIDANNLPKPGTYKVVSKVNDSAVKEIHDNKPETNQDTLKANVHGKQHTKLILNNSNIFRLGHKTSRIEKKKETDRRTTVLKNPNQIINNTVGAGRSDNASERNHTVFNITYLKNPNLNINKDNAYDDDFMAYIRRKNATENVTAINILAPLRFSKTTKNAPNRNIFDFLKNQNNTEVNSNNVMMETAKDLHSGDNHNYVKPKKVKDYDSEENKNDGKKNNDVFTLVVTNEGEGRAEKIKELQDLQLAMNGFDQPETKPVARKPFQKCLTKKARKLCNKSCKSAYRNVCRRMKCTSRSKRALKKECKRSCQKTFKSSKYSDEDSDESRSESGSDESDES